MKSLAKTMGRVGLCTVESYIGGEFFEPNYLDTRDPVLARYFPHMAAPVGGVGFERIAQASTDWHRRACAVTDEKQVPLLGLFKERSEGAGHSYGLTAVRGFTDMTEEPFAFGTRPPRPLPRRPVPTQPPRTCGCSPWASSTTRSGWTTRPTATPASTR